LHSLLDMLKGSLFTGDFHVDDAACVSIVAAHTWLVFTPMSVLT